MSGHDEQTVRQLRASVREWVEDVDEMILLIGHDRWLDIPIRDFQCIGASDDPVAMLVMWGEMAATRMQIASLPDFDDEKRMT